MKNNTIDLNNTLLYKYLLLLAKPSNPNDIYSLVLYIITRLLNIIENIIGRKDNLNLTYCKHQIYVKNIFSSILVK